MPTVGRIMSPSAPVVRCPGCSLAMPYIEALNWERVTCPECDTSFLMVRPGAAARPRMPARRSPRTLEVLLIASMFALLVISLAVMSGKKDQGEAAAARGSPRPVERPTTRSTTSPVVHSPAPVGGLSPTPPEWFPKQSPVEDVSARDVKTVENVAPIADSLPPNVVEAGVFPLAPSPPTADPFVGGSRPVYEFSGVGKDEHLDTKLFKIGDDWGFDWQVRGDIANIVLVDPAGAPLQGADALLDAFADPDGKNPKTNTSRQIWWINQNYRGSVGPQSGHINYHRGGTYALSVWAIGPWRIKVYQYPNRL